MSSLLRKSLEKMVGRVWDSKEIENDFEILGHCYGRFCMVRRKADGVEGTLRYDRGRRFYYKFSEGLENPRKKRRER